MTAALVSLSLAAAVLAGLPQAAQAAAEHHGGRPHAQKVWKPRDVKGLSSTPASAGPARPAAKQAPAVSEKPMAPVWPTATQVDLAVAAPAPAGGPNSSADLFAKPARASVPVTVAPAGTAVAVAGGLARRDAAPPSQSPSKARVSVLDRGKAAAAGVSGVVVTVARADGSTAAGAADVSIDYAAWAQAFGGNFADRLTLVALPPCALTTPDVAACRVQSPIAFVNDRAHRKLVATVALPPGAAPVGSGKSAAGAAPSTAAAAGAPMVLAATASTSGANGTYAATPLKSSDSWSFSGNSGSFEWSYPLQAPASIGGGSPGAALSYDSGSVDGRTTVSNGQTSVVGEGFDLSGAASFIQTTYKPCAKVNPTSWGSSGDLCLGTPNAVVTGGSHAGELVRDDSDTAKWRFANDDGTRFQLLYGTVGGSNNTANQAYWQLTQTDGTVLLYGANRLPSAFGGTGADAPTYSTWSAPVFGTGTGTTCNDPTGTESAQSCLQAWSWGLDFKIDPRGNVTRYTFARELDNYLHSGATTAYTRSGFLREVDYGWQKTDVAKATGLLADGNAAGASPASTILLNYAPRCLYSLSNTSCPTATPTVSQGVATTGITKSNATAFTDVPYDQHCDAGSTTCAVNSPAFFSTVRLAGVNTAVGNGSAIAGQPSWAPANYEAVDSYAFTQSFPPPSDYGSTGNRPQLRLDRIDHTGFATNADGTAVSKAAPSVNLGYDGTKPNRAAASSLYSTAQFFRYRLNQITDELGAATTVAYGQPGTLSCGTTAPPATTANATLCFPEYFNNNGSMVVDWFNKYLVTSVTVADGTATGTGYVYSKPHTSAYTYLGAPAWHTNDSEQADPAYRTVDGFRGFRQVQTVTSGEASGVNSKAVTTYFQGMDQDPTGYVCVNDSHAQGPVTSACPSGGYRDDNALAGQALEVQTYASETSSTVVTDEISVPEDPTDAGMVTATHTRVSPLPVQRAHFSHLVKKIGYQQVSTSSTPRRTETDYTYANSLPDFTNNYTGGNGRLTWTDDKGDTDASGNPLRTVAELCAWQGYASATGVPGTGGLQWTSYPNAQITWSVQPGQSCTANQETAATVTAQSQTLYDGMSYPQVSTGNVTAIQQFPTFNGTPVTTSLGGYDTYGRPGTATDADGNTTRTTYNPASGLLPASVATVNPSGWTSTATLDRGHQAKLSTVDANGRRTDAVIDGFGRVVQAWTPDHPRAANSGTPNVQYGYYLFGTTLSNPNPAQNAYTQTQTLREDGSYAQSFAITDGFGEQIETQATPADGSAGLVSSQAEFNSLGKSWRTAAAHWDGANNPSGTFRSYGDALDSQTVTAFDGLSRPLSVAQYSRAALIPGAVTTNAYPGVDRTDVTGPAGNGVAAASASSSFTDARGRTSSAWTYHNSPPSPTGNPADADITTYGLSYVANGTVSTVTDATTKNTWTTTTTDLLGHHVTKTDPNTGTSSTVMDNVGLLTQATDGRGQVLSFYYDVLGREKGEYNAAWTSGTPDATKLLASWSFDSATDADGKPTLGLPAGSTRFTGGGTNAYISAVGSYDSAGRVVSSSVTIPKGDNNGALAGTYATGNTYTPMTGLLDHTDLPAAGGLAAETVYNSYNVNGLLLATGGNADYVVDTQYDQLGRPLSRTLGDYPFQVVQSNLYDAGTGRVTNSFVDATAGQNANNTSQLNTYSVDDVSYAYDAAGRLTSAADLQNWTVSGSYYPGPAARDLQCYTYDYAGRLTNAWADQGDQIPSATTNLNSPTTRPGGIGSCADSTTNNAPTSASALGGPAPYWQSYVFDATGAAGRGNGALTGNRSSVIDHDPSGNTANDITRTSSYPAAGTVNSAPAANPDGSPVTTGTGPHLLAQVTRSGGASGADTYGYDSAGNTTARTLASGAKQTLSWDAEGRLASLTDTSTTPATTATYLYDGDGNQLIRRDSKGSAGTTTLYLGSTELQLNTATGTVSGNRYYSYAGAPTIVAGSSGSLTYEIGNNQATGGTTVDAASGQVLARRYFKPYGDIRGTAATNWPDDHTFLGKPTDMSTGLTAVGQRTYDTANGRFLSVDPLFAADAPQTIGGYAYAGNDPVNASDPTGLSSDPGNPDGGTGCDSMMTCTWQGLFSWTDDKVQYVQQPAMAVATALSPLPDLEHCPDSVDLQCASGVLQILPVGKGVGLFGKAVKAGGRFFDFFKDGRKADQAANGVLDKLDQAAARDYTGDPSVGPDGSGSDPGGTAHGDDESKAMKDRGDSVGKLPGKANDVNKALGDSGKAENLPGTIHDVHTPVGQLIHAFQVGSGWLGVWSTGVKFTQWAKSVANWFRAKSYIPYKPKHGSDYVGRHRAL